MLPGDYLAYRLTGERTTTASGLSENVHGTCKRITGRCRAAAL